LYRKACSTPTVQADISNPQAVLLKTKLRKLKGKAPQKALALFEFLCFQDQAEERYENLSVTS